MRRLFFAAMLCLCLLLTLVACGNTQSSSDSSEDTIRDRDTTSRNDTSTTDTTAKDTTADTTVTDTTVTNTTAGDAPLTREQAYDLILNYLSDHGESYRLVKYVDKTETYSKEKILCVLDIVSSTLEHESLPAEILVGQIEGTLYLIIDGTNMDHGGRFFLKIEIPQDPEAETRFFIFSSNLYTVKKTVTQPIYLNEPVKWDVLQLEGYDRYQVEMSLPKFLKISIPKLNQFLQTIDPQLDLSVFGLCYE